VKCKKERSFYFLLFFMLFILEKSVESQQSTQAIGAPSKSEKPLITSKVTVSGQ